MMIVLTYLFGRCILTDVSLFDRITTLTFRVKLRPVDHQNCICNTVDFRFCCCWGYFCSIMSHKISDIITEFRKDESSTITQSNNSTKLMISIEFFPPKTETGIASLYKVANQLKTSYPVNFVDVTWGAGENKL